MGLGCNFGKYCLNSFVLFKLNGIDCCCVDLCGFGEISCDRRLFVWISLDIFEGF